MGDKIKKTYKALLKAILGLVPAASGSVRVFGKPYAEQRRLVGYVPQRESVDWDFPVRVAIRPSRLCASLATIKGC